MTTFDFSIHKASRGKKWHTKFTNTSKATNALTGWLSAYGVDGWNGMRAFGEWTRKERLPVHRPDWCLIVARCTRDQLVRFADTCMSLRLSGPAEHAALLRKIESLSGALFVVKIAEF